MASSTIEITFCHTCGFRYKAHWLAERLRQRLPGATVTETPVTAPLGSFVVLVDGKVVYEKSRSFHGSDPQPTPSDVQELVRSLTWKSLTLEEVNDFSELHQAQIVAGASPPWAVKKFNPRTGSPSRQETRT